MQANWLMILDKVISDDFSWQRILFGYSSRLLKFIINLRPNTLRSPDIRGDETLLAPIAEGLARRKM